MIIEICCNSIHSAMNAQQGGADRIELCENLKEGGTTPSYATIRFCTQTLKMNTFVLIRPRAGNFVYSDSEYGVIKEDILLCKELKANGVVVGFLQDDFNIDIQKTAEIVQLAYPMEVTFHRAFDICCDWKRAVQELADCGCRRILTSGLAKNVTEGAELLKEIRHFAENKIQIMAGCGVTHQNLAEIARITAIREFHSSAKKIRKTGDTHKVFPDISFHEYSETDLLEVQKLKNIALTIS